MYGLLQVGILAQELLEKHLNKHGYFQSTHTRGLWPHKWCPIQFTLVVDDFEMKYAGKDNLQHLTSILQESYKISINREGSQYNGIHFDCNYEKRVHLSMPGYVKKALKWFQHQTPSKPQNQPHPHIHQNTEQRYNILNQRIQHQNSARKKQNSFKK
ncbi:hypothetical protein ACHAW6_007786 [Cyclotella cf. meneghiniana]